MSAAAVLNPMEFLRAAAADGAAVVLVVDNTSRCVGQPLDVDRRNGDCGFAVRHWLERDASVIPGATVRIEARLRGMTHNFAGTLRSVSDTTMVVTRPYYTGRIQRRSWVRVSPDAKAWVRLRTASGARVRPLRDVSAGGIGILLRDEDRDIELGAAIPRLEFGLDNLVFIQSGVVRRIEPRRDDIYCGIELVEMPESERQRLVRWVIERERLFILGVKPSR